MCTTGATANTRTCPDTSSWRGRGTELAERMVTKKKKKKSMVELDWGCWTTTTQLGHTTSLWREQLGWIQSQTGRASSKAHEIFSDPLFPQFSWTWPLQGEENWNIQMDRKQNDHKSTCGSSEETTTEEATIFSLLNTKHSAEPFNPQGRQSLEIYYSVSMLACLWISETWRLGLSWVRHLALQPKCWHTFKICK